MIYNCILTGNDITHNKAQFRTCERRKNGEEGEPAQS